MAHRFPNPAILSPDSRLSPVQYRTFSPSPTRSPKRNTDLEHDPLLANLSPRETLNALAEADAFSPTRRRGENALSKSVVEASASERALGVRAAHAGKQLREWCEEVYAWVWPSRGFAMPTSAKELRQTCEWAQRYSGARSFDQEKGHEGNGEDYWGSFPAWAVQGLEKRIDEIRDGMEMLDVEELKDHVRLAHSSSRSRPASRLDYSNTPGMPTDHVHLDDFTALITATIMNALPFIFRLESLLDRWSTRLTILQRVHSWLRGIDDTESSLSLGWESIGRRKEPDPWAKSDVNREAYKIMKAILEEKVVDLGQRTDAMLDLSEGGNDVLPDEWIDRMDAVEEDYRLWVTEAERIVSQNEWETNSAMDQVQDDQQVAENQSYAETIGAVGNVIEQDHSNPEKGIEPTHVLSLDGQGQSLDSSGVLGAKTDYFTMQKPRNLDLQPRVYVESRTPSDMSPPNSASSGGFASYMSSPELSTASRVEFIQSSPHRAISSDSSTEMDAMSRHSSQRTTKGVESAGDSPISSATISPSTRPRALSFTPEPTIDEHGVLVDPATSESEYEPPSPAVENALGHSLEFVRPGVVRNVSVGRSGSHSSSKSTLSAVKGQTPITESASSPHAVPESSRNSAEVEPEIDLAAKATMQEIGHHAPRRRMSGSTVMSLEDTSTMADTMVPNTPSRTNPSSSSLIDQTSRSSTHHSDQKSPPMSPKSTDEQIEDRISSILTSLPTKIRFTSRHSNNRSELHSPKPTPGHKKSDSNSTPMGKLGRAQSSTSGPSTPGLTLSAAKKPRHQPDSEIKLYHLHQPGREIPIKLYIRLVGEGGERVMVRVGGGWADLGEYLKEYATHHGKRSDGRLEVTSGVTFQSMSSVPTLSGFGSSNPSTPSSSRPGTPTSQAPKPLFNLRKTRLSASDAWNPSTPEQPFTSSHTVQQQHHHRHPSTPGSADSSSVPSGSRRSSSRMSWGGGQDDTPLGLAGPKSKLAEISPSKQAWVDGMMDQARKASAEKKKGAEFGELGRVGGTKRLIFKGKGVDG